MPVRPPTRIREIRALAGLSAGELGDIVGITQSGISRIETGRVSISLDVLYKIAAALKVRPGDLLEADTVGSAQFAPLIGDLRLSGGVSVLAAPFELVAVPRALYGAGSAVEAFILDEKILLFGVSRFPRPEDQGKRFVVLFKAPNGFSLRKYEQTSPPNQFGGLLGLGALTFGANPISKGEDNPRPMGPQNPFEAYPVLPSNRLLSGFSTEVGPPSERWMPANSESIKSIWRIVGEFRLE